MGGNSRTDCVRAPNDLRDERGIETVEAEKFVNLAIGGVSTSAMRRCVSGGTALHRCSLPRSVGSGWITCGGTVKLSGLRLGGAGVVRYLSRMTTPRDPLYAGYRYPAELISYAVWLYFRLPLSLRMVEEMLAARGTRLPTRRSGSGA